MFVKKVNNNIAGLDIDQKLLATWRVGGLGLKTNGSNKIHRISATFHAKKTTRIALVSAPQNTKFFKGHARKKNTIKHPNKQALMIDYADLSQIESTSVESMRKRNAVLSCLVWRVKGTAYLLTRSKSATRRVSNQMRGGKKVPLSSMTTWLWIDDARMQNTARTRYSKGRKGQKAQRRKEEGKKRGSQFQPRKACAQFRGKQKLARVWNPLANLRAASASLGAFKRNTTAAAAGSDSKA